MLPLKTLSESHLCDSTVAAPAVRRDNLFHCPPLKPALSDLHAVESSIAVEEAVDYRGLYHISVSFFLQGWGVAKESSVSWVAKLKGDKNSEWKLSNGWSRSCEVISLLLSAGK